MLQVGVDRPSCGRRGCLSLKEMVEMEGKIETGLSPRFQWKIDGVFCRFRKTSRIFPHFSMGKHLVSGSDFPTLSIETMKKFCQKNTGSMEIRNDDNNWDNSWNYNWDNWKFP